MGILNLFDLLRKVLFLRKLNEQEKSLFRIKNYLKTFF